MQEHPSSGGVAPSGDEAEVVASSSVGAPLSAVTGTNVSMLSLALSVVAINTVEHCDPELCGLEQFSVPVLC